MQRRRSNVSDNNHNRKQKLKRAQYGVELQTYQPTVYANSFTNEIFHHYNDGNMFQE